MGVQYVGQVEDSLSAFKPNKSKKKKSHYKTAGKRLVHDKQTKILHIWSSTDEIISLLQFLYAVIRRLGHPLQHTTFNFQFAFYDGAVSMWKYTETLAHLNAQGVFNLRLRNQIKSKSMVLNHLSKDNFVHIENLLKLTKDSIASCEILQANQIVITVHGNVIDSLLDKKSEQLVRGLQNENNKLKRQNFALKKLLENKDKENTTLVEKITALENELRNLRDVHAQLSEEHQGTLHDLGKLSFERDTNVNKIKRAKIFQKIFDTKKSSGFIDTPNPSGSPSSFSKSTTCCDQGLSPSHNQHVCQPQNATQELPSSSQYTPRKQLKVDDVLVESRELTLVNENETSSPNNNRHERSRVLPSHSVEVDKPSEGESLSLRNEPCSSVTAEVRNIYKLLLLTIADRLLLGDIAKLNDWANERFGIDTNLSATEKVCQLDQKGVINAFDLSQLHAFFQSILRFDLVYLIDEFTKGDYPSLRKMISASNPKRQNCVGNSNRNQRSVVLLRNSTPRSSMSPNVFNGVGNNDHLTERTDASTKNGNLSNVNNHGDWSRKLASLRAPTSSASGSSVVVPDEHAASSHGGYISHANSPTTSNSPSTSGENNAMKMPTPSTQDPTNHGSRKQCNGTSQSQPRNRHQTSNTHNMQEKKWLCSHYKRRCHVKFDCCEKFWPCHQCHNKESTCSRKNLKARDTKLVKCSECGKEQQFGEFCVSCNIKFADFYCGLCKHVTGTDDFPYHCDKCGICRIHGDRSFHCDICGVCLDVQLRGNHKCRPGSAHDQCGICLEDAFTGCQILPCSHKVHKNCATQMIQSGITRCPICRESFAHKLNKRPPTRKLSRKR